MIYVEPNAGVTPVVQFIEAAQGQLLINNYYLDDADVFRAISIDVQKGVKVLVVIAGNPYDLTENVEKEKAALLRAGAVVHIAPPQFEDHGGYHDFDHAKYAVARNGALIGTANWDFSAFTQNREYIYTTQSPAIIRALTTIFTADFNGDSAPDISLVAPDLVVSPGSEDPVVATIEQPGAIEVETEKLGTDRNVLRALESKGSAAEIIIPPDGAKPFILSELAADGVQVRTISGIRMHAKMIVGGKVAFIGSENFTITSLKYNREIGVLLNNSADMKTLSTTFQIDWDSAQ